MTVLIGAFIRETNFGLAFCHDWIGRNGPFINMLGNANHLSTLLPKAAESKTGLGCLKNKETQQAAGMNQAKTGLAETNLKLSPLKVGHNWTTQKPKLDFDCLHEFMATTGHKIKRGDFISESQFYKLAINSEKEQSFAEFSTPCIIPKKPPPYFDGG